MNRREFLLTASGGALALAIPGRSIAADAEQSIPASRLPRWRGFNLLEKFVARRSGNPAYKESDFQLLEEWGFNFVRLPMSYWCWSTAEEPMKIREDELKHLDEVVELGGKHGVHVNMNLHRAPGYCVNPPKEPLDLWTEEKALDACAFHWGMLAKRFKGVPSDKLSFDLLNEPADIKEDVYARVVTRLVQAIRAEDPKRLIIADGLKWGTTPVYGLAGLGIAQSTRGYQPMQISHYKAGWIHGSENWAEPTWPLVLNGKTTDKESLRKQIIVPWQALEKKGVGVHVGEWGAHNQTPHDVVLAWMKDCLALWKDADWGWSLWNLHGSFGVLESGRADVSYEDFRGQKLDRKMLDVLRAG